MDPVSALLLLAAIVVLAYIVLVLPLMIIKNLIGIPVALVRSVAGKPRRRR